MANWFSRNNPPKGGKAKKLWDWFTKEAGEEPNYLYVNRPGYWQRSEGTPAYLIQAGKLEYHINNPDWTVANLHLSDGTDGNSLGNVHFNEPVQAELPLLNCKCALIPKDSGD